MSWATMFSALTDLFPRVLEASWHASLIALIVMAVQWTMGNRLSPRWRSALWGIVFVRLLLPTLPASPLSILNLRSPPAVAPLALSETSELSIKYGVISRPDFSRPSPKHAIIEPAHTDFIAVPASIWLLGAMMLICSKLFFAIRFSRGLSLLNTTSDRRLIVTIERCASEMNVHPPICIETDHVRAPALTGIRCPRLLLPRGLVDRISAQELHFVVLHELAHLRRRDVLIGWIIWLIAAIHWFNPVIWLAATMLRREREIACDAAVLVKTELTLRIAYGQTILRVVELFPAPVPIAHGAVGMLSGRRTLHRRIAAISATPPTRWSMLGPIMLLIIGCATLTKPVQPSSTPTSAAGQQDASKVVTRVYDVRDVIIDVPNFTNAPDLNVFMPTTQPKSIFGDGNAEPLPRSRDQLFNECAQAIMDEVAPTTWQARGGAIGEITPATNGELIIKQTPANHDAIQLLLQDMRGARSVQVIVEARFLTGEAVFRQLEKIDADKRWQAAKGHQVWPGYLTDQQTKALLASVQTSPQSTMMTAPRITLFNGQRAYVLVSRQTAFVGDFKPSTTQPGTYEPQIGLAQSGILLDIEVNVSADRKNVTLMLRPQISTLLDLTPQPWPGAPAGTDALIVQVPHRVVTKIETTTAVPDGQTALFRLRPKREPASTTQPAEKPVLLMVRPNIIITTDIDKPSRLLSTRPASQPASSQP